MGPFQGTLAGLMLTLGGVLGVSDPPTLGTTWGGGGGLGGGGPCCWYQLPFACGVQVLARHALRGFFLHNGLIQVQKIH